MTFVLYEDVEPIDLAAIGVISMAKRIIQEVSYETTAESIYPVKLSNGLRVLPDRTFNDIQTTNILLVPGGPGWRLAAQNTVLLDFVRRMQQTAMVCSVCTGAMILAQAGLLTGLDATTKQEVVAPEVSPLRELQERFPEINSRHALLIDHGHVMTGGGVSLCIDAVLYLLEKQYGKASADEVARIMEYSAARAENQRRFAVNDHTS